MVEFDTAARIPVLTGVHPALVICTCSFPLPLLPLASAKPHQTIVTLALVLAKRTPLLQNLPAASSASLPILSSPALSACSIVSTYSSRPHFPLTH